MSKEQKPCETCGWKELNNGVKVRTFRAKEVPCPNCQDKSKIYNLPAEKEMVEDIEKRDALLKKCQDKPSEFRQKVTCALLDSRSDEQQLRVALNLSHEACDIIDQLTADLKAKEEWISKYQRMLANKTEEVGHLINQLEAKEEGMAKLRMQLQAATRKKKWISE